MERYDYDFHCTKLFEEGVRAHRYGDVSIIHQSNDVDCFILDIPAKAELITSVASLVVNDSSS